MSRYAENTSVSSDRSRAEIEQILARYGAEQFMYGWDRETGRRSQRRTLADRCQHSFPGARHEHGPWILVSR